MNLRKLTEAIANDAALRRRQVLQPVGGKGDKIFPPTYPGEGKNAPPRHVFEKRRIGDREIWCVLVDSVQSQANRLEESLLDAINDNITIPHVVVDFSGSDLAGVTQITSLDAPHRVYDAILRDSLTADTPPPTLHVQRYREKACQGQLAGRIRVAGNLAQYPAVRSLVLDGPGRWLGSKVRTQPDLGDCRHQCAS